MKKTIYSLLCTLLLLGCQAPTPGPIQETKEKQISPKEQKIVKNKQGNLKHYRPQVGTIRTYTNAGEEIYTHEIVSENDEYIQQTVYLSGAPTTQIYRWTDDEIALVYEIAGNQPPELLDEFIPFDTAEMIMNSSGQAEWSILEKNTIVTVPAGTFSNVVVVKKITDEVEGAETIYTRYYAPSIGLIKETYEVTGKNGYKDEANLENSQ